MRKLTLRSVQAPRGDSGLSDVHWLLPVGLAGGPAVLSASLTSSAIGHLALVDGSTPRLQSLDWSLSTQPMALADVSLLEAGGDRWLFNLHTDGRLGLQNLTQSGDLGRLEPVLTVNASPVVAQSIHAFSVGAAGYLATGARDGNGLSVFRVTETGRLDSVFTETNAEKKALERVTDFTNVTVGGATYLISASNGESGVSSFLIEADGTNRFVDSLSQKDGLWISGLVALEAVELGGQGFVLGLSPLSGNLSVLRVNPMGVFFITDIVVDTLDTRFDDAVDLAAFRVGERAFAVLGGTDRGLTFFELLPNGRLFHHFSLEQDQGWDVGPIRSVSAQVMETEVQILLGSAFGGIVQFDLPLEALPDNLYGSAGNDALRGRDGDDLILGYGGNDGLSGGAGDDTLVAGTGHDALWGGAGADVFVFEADGQADRIMDFQPGLDRIDLSDWGRLYDISALDIRALHDGAVIRWQAEELRIYTDDGGPLDVGALSNDDFLFY